ncbi:hypothetical protein [Rhizobium sp. LEGMi135b]
MNKIVLEHYPVSKLPEDVRDRLQGDAPTVRLVIEDDEKSGASSSSPFAFVERENVVADNLENLLRRYREHPENFSGKVTVEEAVARIRKLRDEWDDE